MHRDGQRAGRCCEPGARRKPHSRREHHGTGLVNPIKCGSWLACDAGNWVYQEHRGVAIAGKPAPTGLCSEL
ncbi:hypothetical protein C7A10_15935 [Pseudomonas fluorescens]|uniref:Uncharacterized protein n=1 Tax=Pseudomonas fluorescens TaxID=294 RepID=A0A2T0IAJ3_PSEFL|nr:hypothetical protein C7A10_15935 [Pseudomonas fluorescens]